jgi:hypothetical protein
VALYLTLFGVVAGLVSTFWTFGYTRLARRLRGYSLGGARGALRRVRKRDVLATLERGCWINVLGMAATLLGLQATVGLLVAKTLTNATANPFLAGGVGSYNPVLALDVFLVQARGRPPVLAPRRLYVHGAGRTAGSLPRRAGHVSRARGRAAGVHQHAAVALCGAAGQPVPGAHHLRQRGGAADQLRRAADADAHAGRCALSAGLLCC